MWLGMIVLSRIDYRLYRKFKWPIFVVIIGLLLAVRFVGMSSRTEQEDG